MTNDPFTQVLERLWELLEGHAPLAAMVRPGNRIKLTGDGGDPYKQDLQHADRPELVIEPGRGEVRLAATSTSTTAAQDFDLRLATGSLHVAGELFPITWEIVKALAAAGEALGLDFVRNVRLIALADSRTDAGANRGVRGWSTVLTVRVEMWFARAELTS